MSALQVQQCLGALRCQTAVPAFLAPLALFTIGFPRRDSNTQTRAVHQYVRRVPIQHVYKFTPFHSRLWQPVNRCPSAAITVTARPRTYTTSPSPQPMIHPVFEPRTGTFQYLVADPSTKTAVIIDPVLDYDKCSQTITTTTADALLSLVREKGYTISHILETHAHADHLTASFYLQKRLVEQQGSKPPVCIGARIGQVQSLFGKRYGITADEYEGVFDRLLRDDEELSIGKLKARAIHLPGHTPDHMGYKIGDNVFVGDSLFHVDIGTARCDFPGGSAHDLYKSAKKLLSLPGEIKIWTGHDYPPEGERDPVPSVSVREHREKNRHVRDGVSEDQFVAMRSERDAHLSAPKLLHESLQVNVRAGRLPRESEVGMRLLKVPVKTKGGSW